MPKDFGLIFQQIVNWVEGEAAAFGKAHPEDGPEHIFSIGDDDQARAFTRRYPGAGEHLAAYMIHRWLLMNLFDDNVYRLGLPEELAHLL